MMKINRNYDGLHTWFCSVNKISFFRQELLESPCTSSRQSQVQAAVHFSPGAASHHQNSPSKPHSFRLHNGHAQRQDHPVCESCLHVLSLCRCFYHSRSISGEFAEQHKPGFCAAALPVFRGWSWSGRHRTTRRSLLQPLSNRPTDVS